MGHLIDTHCHLSFSAYSDDIDEVIQRALDRGIYMITLGADYETSQRAVELAEKYSGVYAAIGQHPVDVGPGVVESFEAEKYQKLLDSTDKVVAAGEMGLDYTFFDKEKHADLEKFQDVQQDVFRQQIRWAQKNQLPIAIHNRDTHENTLEILKSEIGNWRAGEPLRGVAHFFTGTQEQAQRYFELGFLVSFTGVITISSKFNDLVRELPLEKIMVETDAPYAAPDKYRGQRNEPVYVERAAKKIAKLKNISIEEVVRQTTQNAQNLFNI